MPRSAAVPRRYPRARGAARAAPLIGERKESSPQLGLRFAVIHYRFGFSRTSTIVCISCLASSCLQRPPIAQPLSTFSRLLSCTRFRCQVFSLHLFVGAHPTAPDALAEMPEAQMQMRLPPAVRAQKSPPRGNQSAARSRSQKTKIQNPKSSCTRHSARFCQFVLSCLASRVQKDISLLSHPRHARASLLHRS